MKNRIETAVESAIGKAFRVRVDDRTTISGTITACQFIDMVPAGRGQKPRYEVTMSCGTKGVERKFIVTKLP